MRPALGELVLPPWVVLVAPLVAYVVWPLPALVAPLQYPGPFLLQGQAVSAMGRAVPVVEALPRP